jgi:hypothetical protein
MMQGFPNLFMTTGPTGPAALANIIRISEHDVDWIANAMVHMEQHHLASMEPTAEAEARWMELVATLAQRTLVSKAKTWYVGANVEGKAQGLTLFTGGFQKYREYCRIAAEAGYQDFTFEPAGELVGA